MAVVLGAFVPDTAAQWRRVVKAEVARQLGVAAEARKLAERLERVGAALGDAEARAARGDEAAARWLGKVRAAAYEADGAVDRCRVAARRRRDWEQRQQHQALPWLLSSCCDADEPRRDVAADLKNVNQKLQAILKEQHHLQLHASVAYHTVHARTVLRHRKSEPTDIDIVGARIEDDARRLVRRLTETDGQAACTIVAIVAPDGIGKTTLAKMVYESERVLRSFETRSWVRLPRGYTVAGLLSQVIDAVGGDTTGAESVADLEAMLAGLVANKRFLLVLDDVWYGGVWEDVLRSPLERGGRGSKVLVTARHGSIAREMGAGHVHRVKRLGDDDGWLLLRVAACVADESEAGKLKGVGDRIVEKCGGVPLAIKAVAGVLRTREASAGEWAEVLANPVWSVKGLPDNSMKPLYLCYDDLPCHLKQCFLYCSLFPSDFTVDRRVLVQLWIAEGFVRIRGDVGVEAVAEEYYDELIGRNLLQPAEADAYSCTERCTMHDMLRGVAQLLSQGEDLTGDAPRLLDDSDTSFAPRRVSFPRRNLAAIPEKILMLEWLRTLLLQKNPLKTEGNIFTRLYHLKVLDLSETGIELIPESLGNLIYLRFLNLSQTRIQAVPESIGNLWSLKFLLLRECKSLHALPKGIEHLRGLRDLDLAGTVIDDAAFRVGQLRSLTSLRCFAVTSKEARDTQDRSGWPLDELKNLCQLRTLHVQKLEKATGRSEATEVALAEKTGLRELELSCSSTVRPFQTPAVVSKIEDVFEELNPPQCLVSLKIANYFGTKFPRWLSVIVLPNIRRLDIIGCNFCQSLPPLGRLPELRSLYIADSLALKDIDAEFMGTDQHHQAPFPKLENLHLQGLHKLKTWMDIEAGALPSLQALQLESCPELRCLPGGLRHATSLMELRIVDMAILEAVEDIAALRELSVWNTPNLKKISNMPSLEDLNICHCPVLQTVENVDRLRVVHIFDHEMQEMPRWIEAHASNLCSLYITSMVELLKRCLVDGPDWPMIKDIVQVHGYSTGSSYIYYSKSPYIFESSVNTQENLDMEENAADSDNVDNASTESRTVNQEDVSVSASSTGYLEISGFFDSKTVKTGTTRTEDNVLHRNTERSMLRLTRRRMHKLAEVVPEDGEVEEGADLIVRFPAHPAKAGAVLEKLRPIVTDDRTDNNDLGVLSKAIPHESRAITNDGTDHDAVASSVLTRRRGSKMGKGFPTDAGTAADTSVIKSAAAIGHNLVREGSRAINITETNQILNFSLIQSEEHTSNKGEDAVADSGVDGKGRRGHDTANKMPSTVSVDKSIPEMVKRAPTQVAKSESKVSGNNRTENDSPASLAPFRQVTSKKGKDASTDADATTPAIRSSNMVTRKHLDKVNGIATSATESTNATPMPENPSGKEVTKKSAGVIGSSLIHEGLKTVSVTETAQGLHSSLLHSEQRLCYEGKEVSDFVKETTSIAVDNTGDQMEENSISLSSNLNHEESKAIGVTETSCDTGPCKFPASLACSKQRTPKKQQAIFDDTDASVKKILGMASKISEKVGSKCTAESVKDSSAETAKNTTHSPSKPVRTMSHAIDITEAAMKAEATMANRFSTNEEVNDGLTDDNTPFSIKVKCDDSHQAPKVYTAIWADTDTDTDTLRARFVNSMQHYRRMAASRRRRCHRKHGSENKWSICPVLVAVLLFVSMVQLLFIIWLYRRLLNQK